MNAIIKRLKSKTYWAAILGAAITAFEANGQLIGQHLPESIRWVAVMMWPALMVALREVTKEPLSEK